METISVKQKMDKLAQRAKQRRIALPAIKTESDIKTEKKAFEDLKVDVYKNIVRSE